MAEVFVLARNKRSNRVYSYYLTEALIAAGIDAYRVTPTHCPLHRPEDAKMVINYGVSAMPIWWDRLPQGCLLLNHPEHVGVSAHKLHMMFGMEHVFGAEHMLEGYTSRDAAQQAIDNGKVIMARTKLTSHSGKGIVISPPDELPDARLYTVVRRGRNVREYRIFYVLGKVVGAVCKRRKSPATLVAQGTPPALARTWWDDVYHTHVRAWKNGWTFSGNLPVDDPALLSDIAGRAGRMLPWGVVDVLIDTETKQWWAIEVNSAPALDAGLTMEGFVNEFKRILNVSKEVR